MPVEPGLLNSLRWRCIGPYRGGRSVAVAGDPSDQMVFYFGACAGGVWKTFDGGTYWENVSDGFFTSASIGAIAVAESDPNVLYAGTGEACIRGNVAHGDGVYKSTDGGKTWANVGLRDTRHIARIRIHPKDPDTVYVAALGHAYGPNDERGVFRSTDGGESWEWVLFKSEKAGAIDLSMDPGNPGVLYAALWEVLRQPWEFSSGGQDSGLYKSTDGGDTWTDISDNPGLPGGVKGRIGVAVSPPNPERVWALIEAEERGLYRSDDGGDSWERVSEEPGLMQRPWYYTHVFADTQDADTVYAMNLKAWRSTDGGRTFDHLTTPHGDNHELWMDPNDSRRMIQGNDGGACVSFNGGESWTSIYNQPTAQFYHLTTDDRFPYRVYGTQQDNSAVSVPSRSIKGAITWAECYMVGNSESGHIAVRPDDQNIVYSGAIGSAPGGGDALLRYDHGTGQVQIISAWPELTSGWAVRDYKYRFQWTYPIVISPHDPNVLYVAGNVLFRSENEGISWEAISPDLTRADDTKMDASGGPVTLDTTGVEHYGTIFSFVESPHEQGLFWAGSDDGLVHISRDGGVSWDDVTPDGLPEWTRIDTIEVSPHDPATAYLSATRYRLDDLSPHLYKTNDYGKSWVKITDGIPEDEFTRVIRADPTRPGLLYAGTESGAYVSFDDGGSWQSLQSNLPVVPVTDLTVKGDELVAATNGRSFWILDDLALVRQIEPALATENAHLFEPGPTYRFAVPTGPIRPPSQGKNYGAGMEATSYVRQDDHGATVRTFLNAGSNPPEGVVASYHLGKVPEGEATLTFLDSQGQTIKSFSSSPPEQPARKGKLREQSVPMEVGANRFVWNMRYPDARRVEGDGAAENGIVGPLAPPGTYQVRLTIGGNSQTQSFQLLPAPGVSAAQEDLDAQHSLLLAIRDKISETHDTVGRIRGLRAQVDEWAARCEGADGWEAVAEAATRIKEKLWAVEDTLILSKPAPDVDRSSTPARLNAKVAELVSVVSSADSVPTRQSYQVFEEVSARVEAQISELGNIVDNDIPTFVDLLHELEIPPIMPAPRS